METYKDNFFVEMFSQHEGYLHALKSVLFEGQTRFQKVQIVDTHEYGRCLLLDGLMQSSQADEYIYHECLVHPAMIAHPNPRRVLIVGGGEGATLREVLRYPSVLHVDMIEIDAQVLEFAREHLLEWHQGAFDDPRTHLIIADGRRYIEAKPQPYDVIILDVSDPSLDGPAYLLYTFQFYQAVSRCLNPHGLVVVQAGSSSITQGRIMASIYTTLTKAFPEVCAYEAYVPSFNMPWGFCIAAARYNPCGLTAEMVDKRLADRGIQNLRAYDGETHAGLFHLTKALRMLLATQGRVIEDSQPIFTPR